MSVTAAQTASTADLGLNPRSSYYVTDKGPSPAARAKAKTVKACKSVLRPFKNLFIKKSSTAKIRRTPAARHSATFLALTGERPPAITAADPVVPDYGSRPSTASASAPVAPDAMRHGQTRPSRKHLSLHQVADADGIDVQQPLRPKSVYFKHPTTDSVQVPQLPATPATASTDSNHSVFWDANGNRVRYSGVSNGTSSPLSLGPNMVNAVWRKNGRPDETQEFVKRLDGETKAARQPTRPVSTSVQKTPPTFQPAREPKRESEREMKTALKQSKNASGPPAIRPFSPFDPRISGFDDFRKPFVPGMFVTPGSRLDEVANASAPEVQENSKAAADAVAGLELETADNASEQAPPDKGKKAVYRNTYLSTASESRLYQAYEPSFGRPFTVYGDGRPYPSSTALVADREAAFSRPSTAGSSISSPALPFTPTMRHSQFYGHVEMDGTSSPALRPRPANPEPPASPDTDGSAKFLKPLHMNAPAPPPQSKRVPMPARKPVPTAAVAGPSNTKANVYKALPASPAPNSPRRFTIQPIARTTFPPRTDSLDNRIVVGPSTSSPPPLNPNIPTPFTMNDNGYIMYDARSSASYNAAPGYVYRGPMNEMETKALQFALNREASRKAAETREKAKFEKARQKALAKEEKAVKKLCNLQ